MADQANPSNGDLVNLDAATEEPLDSGLAASSGESILNAAEVFQQQLEQMTTWKQKLGQQMDLLRRDGIKLMERQKQISLERKALTDERGTLDKQRDDIQKVQSELDAQNSRLAKRAGELESAQNLLADLQGRREQHERELGAREKSLHEHESRLLAEDVRLKSGVEQLEQERRHLAEAQRKATADRETLDRRAAEQATRSQSLDEQGRALDGREGSLTTARQELEKAQTTLRGHQEDLAARERILAEQLRTAANEQQRITDERQSIAKQKLDLQRRVEEFEREQGEQLEAIGKQSKRLAERRVQLDTAENDLEAALADRIKKATDAMRAELASLRGNQTERVAQLEQQARQAEEATARLREKETALQNETTSLQNQLQKLRDELTSAGRTLDKANTEKSLLANQLAEQIQQGEQEAEKWQKALDQAQAAGEDKSLQRAQAQASAAREKIDALKQQLKQLQAAKDELEFQLEIRTEETSKALEAQKHELGSQIAQRDEEIATLQQKLAVAAAAQSNGLPHAEKVAALAEQLATSERERHALATQLSLVQESLRREQSVTEQVKAELEGKIAALQGERDSWRTGNVRGADGSGDADLLKQTGWQRQRLLRQAKALRAFRGQVRETERTLEKGRADIAQQRDSVRLRRENLEQVKRLLEKQEMVMARKLADHNAIKTVAAVGIFVIMVLGGVFFGVYRFVHPVYRSEAMVQLAPPDGIPPQDLESWTGKQLAFIRSNEVTFAAWQALRSSDEHYSMNDVREEWLASLNDHLSLKSPDGGKSVSITYRGPDAEGVSQVANALAAAYTTPGKRESTEDTKAYGLNAQVMAKATVPAFPVEDTRLTTFAIGVAGVLLVSMLAVMIFRHFVARQLREIDEMTDIEEHNEDNEGATPALEG